MASPTASEAFPLQATAASQSILGSLTPVSQPNGELLLAHALGVWKDVEELCSLDAVLLSMDLESEIHQHEQITEIGVSTLDTRNIEDRNTDAGLYEWLSTLESTHLRLENSGKKIARINDRHGRPLWAARKFAFGRSEWTSLDAARITLHDLFCVPDDSQPSSATSPRYRNVIVVGHAWSNEDAYLSKLGKGFTLKSFGTVLAVVDTQTLNREGRSPPSLASLLYHIRVCPADMHNGGNDAAYTMVAAIAHEIKRLREQNHIQSVTESGMNAESVVDRLEENGRAVRQARPLDPHRCDTCGMLNHVTEECYSTKRCTACGKAGHPRLKCRWSTCEECKADGHVKENCPKNRNKRATLGQQGQPSGSVLAAKALAEAHEKVFAGKLTDTSSFPTLGAATPKPTTQTNSMTLGVQKMTVKTSIATQDESPKKQGQATKKNRKRFQKLDVSF